MSYSVTWLKWLDGFSGRLLVKLLPSPPIPTTVVAHRVLIIRPGGIGDAVLLAPMVRALKTLFPDTTVDILVERRNCGIIALYGAGAVSRVFCYDRPKDFAAVLFRRYDVIIDTEQWYRLSAVIARLIRAQMRIGFASNERGKLFSHPVAYSKAEQEITSFLGLLGPLLAKGAEPPAAPSPFLKIPHLTEVRVRSLLEGLPQKSLVVLFPGASVPEKRWGGANFRQVSLALLHSGYSIVVVGGREDAVEGAQIVAGGAGLDLAGKTSLVETAAIISKAAVVVSGDSGILHLASGLGRPTVSLFGPSNANKWAPRGPAHLVVQHKLPCSPCSSFGRMPKCLENGRCLQEITVEEVTTAVSDLLQRVKEGELS